jgi:TorA maturation chaperone TorD
VANIKELLELRKNFYGFLARMYLEAPPQELAEDIANKRFSLPLDMPRLNRELTEGIEILKDYMQNVKLGVKELYDELEWEYTRLFIGPYIAPIVPYESSYIDKRMMGKSMIRARKKYMEVGIGKSPEFSESEDHIGLELQFMCYLCDREIEGLEKREDISEYLDIQNEFLNDCLLRWVPDFCNDILKSDKAAFYKGIAKITRGFLFLDNDIINELLKAR